LSRARRLGRLRHPGARLPEAALRECGHDKLQANSRKRRGFCPSCGARRDSQTAAHRVDLPQVPARQWVQSRPIPLRLLLAAQPGPVSPVLL